MPRTFVQGVPATPGAITPYHRGVPITGPTLTAPLNTVRTWMSLADFVETPVGRELLPFRLIREQLPDGIARRVSLKIDRDPYELMCWADFTSKDGRHFCAQAEMPDYKLSDVFISRICLVL